MSTFAGNAASKLYFVYSVPLSERVRFTLQIVQLGVVLRSDLYGCVATINGLTDAVKEE